VISVVIPTLNAARRLPATLGSLMEGVIEGLIKEAIIVDGGSEDETAAIAEAAGCAVIQSPRGRARQMIAGAAAARGQWLLFLHADTQLEPGWSAAARAHLGRPGAEDEAAAFRFAFDARGARAAWVAFWVRIRCAALALPYGDQGLLISRRLHDALGGFRDMALMEDVDLVRRIGRKRLRFLPARAITSAEKYARDGYVRRASRNLLLLARYAMGADPKELAKAYD
jgi:rSAM/selenodomain-associated transferase 2